MAKADSERHPVRHPSQFLSIRPVNKRTRVKLSPEPPDLTSKLLKTTEEPTFCSGEHIQSFGLPLALGQAQDLTIPPTALIFNASIQDLVASPLAGLRSHLIPLDANSDNPLLFRYPKSSCLKLLKFVHQWIMKSVYYIRFFQLRQPLSPSGKCMRFRAIFLSSWLFYVNHKVVLIAKLVEVISVYAVSRRMERRRDSRDLSNLAVHISHLDSQCLLESFLVSQGQQLAIALQSSDIIAFFLPSETQQTTNELSLVLHPCKGNARDVAL